jgi:hypothetical protein
MFAIVIGNIPFGLELKLPAGFGQNAINMAWMFGKKDGDWQYLPANFSLPVGFGSKAQNMEFMFLLIYFPDNFHFPVGFGGQALNMISMFYSAYLASGFGLPAGFSSQAVNIGGMWQNMHGSIETLILPTGFGQVATDMHKIFFREFEDEPLPFNIDWSGTDFTGRGNIVDRRVMFTTHDGDDYKAFDWDGHILYVKNQASKTFFITGETYAPDNNVVIK